MTHIIEIHAGEGKVLHRVVEYRKVKYGGNTWFVKPIPGWDVKPKKYKPNGTLIPLSL